ncbi:MAG TPA: aspartyl/asparaginyl beta-hydroxylase domain-containing protein [Novosphingobium sp.]|nr:aspartyl/asparaginyl beta-hydroxylase domain-containing protein [Novosphingobium sp.]
MTSDPRAAIDQGLAALANRDAARAAALLREAAAAVPAAEMPWTALGNAELALGNRDAAEAALERQLEQTPRDIGALLLKAWLREQAGDARSASSFYRAALNQAAVDGRVPPALARLHQHAGTYVQEASGGFEAYLLERIGTDLSPTMTEALELLTGKRELYLQEPSVFYYPGLPQKRFYDPADFPWLEPMLALVPAMQAELAAVLGAGAEGFAPYVHRKRHRPAPNSPLLDSEAWTAFHFWRDGERDEDNAARCPATMEALGHAPMPQIAGRSPNAHWSRLLPGAHIAAHTGMLNTRLICHIPIKTAPDCWFRVGSEVRGWVDGVPLVFDDSINHEAKNDGPEERVVLLFEIWRPEIDPADREAIGRIFQAIGEYD